MKLENKSRKQLVKTLDTEFSKFIRNRDKKCVICGTRENLTNGHLFSRVSYSTRWDEINCHCQCTKHNLIHESNPHIFTNWFIHKFSVSVYDDLLFRHNQTLKLKDYELIELILKYRELNNETTDY